MVRPVRPRDLNEGEERPSRSALVAALSFLTRRPLTVRELEHRLLEAGHSEEEVAEASKTLQEDQTLDDRNLAAHFMAVRMERKGHGPARLSRDLENRGVDKKLIASVLEEGIANGDLNPNQVLERIVRKKAPGTGLTLREYRRLYNALLRAGFDSMSIRRHLDRYDQDPEAPDKEEQSHESE
jgi:regulatory protein